MRLLFVTHLFPYPPIGGGRLGFFNPLKYLSRRMEIVLVSQTDSEPEEFVDEMRQYCLDVKVRPVPKFPYLALAHGWFGQPPGTYAKYYDPGFGKVIGDAASEWNVDLAELHCLHTAAYRSSISFIPVILREHNIDYKVWTRQAECTNNLLERIYVSAITPRIKAYEARVAPQFNRCIAVSEKDADYLRDVAPAARIDMIPSGVDTEYFFPDPAAREEPYSMVLTGTFGWRPKQHNLAVLLTKLYPRIKAKVPGATLTIVGTGVPDRLRDMAAQLPGVRITGSVPDVRPYLRKSALALNYLESGGGIALKVLEAMAMRKPVLSNSLGCEGIRVKHDGNVLLADEAESFAEAAALLLRNSALRERIAEGGYRLVQREYAWEQLAGRFHDCYTSVLSEGRAVAQPVQA